MKRFALIALLVGVVAGNNAFASRARNLIWGQGDGGTGLLNAAGQQGSFYVNDAYNMFYNPAYVNDFGSWATIERYTGTGATAGDAAMGGLATSIGSLKFAAFMNRESETAPYTAGSAGTNLMNPLDLVIGGDMGFKWGLGLTWAAHRASDTTKSSLLNARLGFAFGDLEPFLDFRILNSDTIADVVTKYNSMGAGLKYHFGEWTPYFAVHQDSTSVAGGTAGNKISRWGIGIGRNMSFGEGVKVNYQIGHFLVANGSSAAVSGAGAGATRTVIPVNVSAEGDVISWLTLRAGLGYNLMDRVGGVSAANATTGRMGATIHVGKLDIDWTIGGSAGSAAAEVGDGQADINTFGVGDAFFTSTGVTYKM